ncbi:hypothetical protein IAD21_02400 [Abditibacteriota bacterium]|nr:hypothetical protein IAD21_02400 [Abditibacteriota bacterium]
MQFLLPPWDRNRPRLHPPQVESVMEVNGKSFGLRAQNGILFFREALNPSKTWAIGTPLTPELEGDKVGREAFFRREFERGNVARYVVHLDSYVERTLPLFLRGDGTGWCREAWNRDDLTFSHSVSMHVWLEGDDKTVIEDMRDVERQLDQQLEQLPYPDDLKNPEVEWLCGSQEGLYQLAHSICALENAFWKANTSDVTLNISAENSFARAYIREVELHGATENFNASHMWMDVDENDQSRLWSGESMPLSRRFWSLFDIALDQNTPIGLHWEYRDYGQYRTADEPYAPSVELRMPRPTSIEQLEALGKLRQWLAPILPEAEVERLLNDDAIVLLPKTRY